MTTVEFLITSKHLNHQAVTLLTKSMLHQMDFVELSKLAIPEKDNDGYVHWLFQRVVLPAYTTTDELVYMIQVDDE